jgi:sortilin (neurotensin receptor 3)
MMKVGDPRRPALDRTADLEERDMRSVTRRRTRFGRLLGLPVLALLALLGAWAPPTATAAAGAPPSAAAAQLPSGVLHWRNIGPLNGGRSIAVAGSAARPNEYWFGATGGGVWKSSDGGTSWSPVSDGFLTSSSVGAIAVCPSDPDVVYAGTGEVDLRGDVIPGDGVYRTVDGGRTWAHVGLAATQTISRIRIDPADCDRAYVAALGHPFGPNPQRGVFRTTDGGRSWTRVLFSDDLTGAADLALDPANSRVIYASMWHAFRNPWQLESGGGTGDGLFKSIDGGTTWQNLSTTPGFPTPPLGKIGIAVSPVTPSLVWALVEAQGKAEASTAPTTPARAGTWSMPTPT